MKAELLAPAGNLEKAKIALLYGADAVYVGGTRFSLRARASNFTLAMLEELVAFAHERHKKVYVTMNIVPHDEDFEGLDEYLLALEAMQIDAIICSSLAYIERAKALTSLEIHLSTQFSVTNALLAEDFYHQGVKRVVLARELTIDDIRQVKQATSAELEIFIHGGMCVSYSGRCTLSNTMTQRDANRGGCAHSCRWLYDLYHKDQLLSDNFDFQMSSKDLEAIDHLPALLDIGVHSLKIEGRMKSIHYIATVVLAYRMLMDDYYAGDLQPLDVYREEIKKAENRLTSDGFLGGEPSTRQQLYNARSETPTKEFVGIVKTYDPVTKLARIEQRNYFTVGDMIEIASWDKTFHRTVVRQIFDQDMQDIDTARHPLQILYLPLDVPVKPYDMVRRVL